MPLIDYTYFIGEINLPTHSLPVKDQLAVLIGKYETEYLEKALGYSLMKAFVEGLAADAPVQRWLDLRNGVEYTDCKGVVRKWKGLLTSDKQSPIADYIYFWVSRNNSSYTSSSGEVQSKSENATSASPALKQSRAYNEMSKWTDSLYDYLKNAKTGEEATYPEFDIRQTTSFGTTNIFNI